MRLNLNFLPKALDGKEVETETVAKTLANAMAFAQSEDPLKVFAIAQQLYTDGEIDLSLEDLGFVKSFVETNKHFVNLLKAVILLEIGKVTK